MEGYCQNPLTAEYCSESLLRSNVPSDVNRTDPFQFNTLALTSSFIILAMAWNHEVVLASLAENQIQELSIIKLSEPISAAQAPDAAKRASDVSTDAFENPSPTSLEADLGHYKVSNEPRVSQKILLILL